MTGRRDSHDRRLVLSALTTAGRARITLLGLSYLSGLPQSRVLAALRGLMAAGAVEVPGSESGGELSGCRRVRYRLAPARVTHSGAAQLGRYAASR